MSTHIKVIITKLPWSGEAQRLIGPRGRVESLEAKRPRRVGHAWYKTDITAYTSTEIKLRYYSHSSHQYNTVYQYNTHVHNVHVHTHIGTNTNTGYNYMSTIQLKFYRYTYTIHVIRITRRSEETQKRREHSPISRNMPRHPKNLIQNERHQYNKMNIYYFRESILERRERRERREYTGEMERGRERERENRREKQGERGADRPASGGRPVGRWRQPRPPAV